MSQEPEEKGAPILSVCLAAIAAGGYGLFSASYVARSVERFQEMRLELPVVTEWAIQPASIFFGSPALAMGIGLLVGGMLYGWGMTDRASASVGAWIVAILGILLVAATGLALRLPWTEISVRS